MRTPAGTDCPHYFEDFHRGRNVQECRLIDQTPNGGHWTPDLCLKCRVPKIVLANACPNLVLEARARSAFFGFRRHVEITASCSQTLRQVDEPEIGCGECHRLFPFETTIEDPP